MSIKNPNTSFEKKFKMPSNITDGYNEVRLSMGELVCENFQKNLRSPTDDNSVIINGVSVSLASIQGTASQSFIDFYNKKVPPFVLQFGALPFDVRDFLSYINEAMESAIKHFNPTRGAVFTTYLYKLIKNKLLSRWKAEISKAKASGWFVTYPLDSLVESITRRVEARETALDSDFTPGRPPVKVTDISDTDMAIIDSTYERNFPHEQPRACFMLYKQPEDMLQALEKKDAFERIERAIVNDSADKRRSKRSAKLLHVLRCVRKGMTFVQIAAEMNKKESQIRRWVNDIEWLAMMMSNAA